MQQIQLVMTAVAIGLSVIFVIRSLLPNNKKTCCGHGCGTEAPSAGRVPLTMTDQRVFKHSGSS